MPDDATESVAEHSSRLQPSINLHAPYHCIPLLMVTAYDFESGRLGLNPEWGPIYYKASITA